MTLPPQRRKLVALEASARICRNHPENPTVKSPSIQATNERRVSRPEPAQHRLWRLHPVLRNWPFWVWLLLSALCLALYLRSTQYGIITGTVQAIHHDAAPLQLARVKELYVQIGSHVTKGQAVAQLDTTLLDTQLAEAEATLAAAQSTMAGYQGQMLNLMRTVEDEIAEAQNALTVLSNQQAGDTAKWLQLKSIQAERDKQLKASLITQQLADELRPDIAYLEKQVAAYPAQLALNQRALESHCKQRADLQHALRLGPEDDILKALADKAAQETKVLEAVVEMRKRERETYTLRSETDGVVSDLLVFPGVVAKPGEPVVSIVSQSDMIIGYLPEFRLGRLKAGDQGYAFRIGHPAVQVQVLKVVPEVNSLPVQLSPISAPLGATLRSQKIVFQILAPTDITPGEKVEIRLQGDSWSKAKRWLAAVGK